MNIQIKKLIEELDEAQSGKGSLWQELLFMQKHGFNTQILLPIVREKISEWAKYEAAIKESERDTIIDSLIVQLYDLLSQKYPNSNLDNEVPKQILFQKYDSLEGRGWRSDPDAHLISSVTQCVINKNPGIGMFAVLLSKHNQPLGFSGGPNDKFIIRSHWIPWAIEDCLCDVAPPKMSVKFPEIIWQVWSNLKNSSEGSI